MQLYDRRLGTTGQMYCNSYCIESFFNSLIYNNPRFGFTVLSTDVPASSPILLRTNSLNYVMPGIAGKYGMEKNVNVIFTLKGARNYRSWYDNDNIYARTDMNLKFNVTTDAGWEEGLSIDTIGMDTYFSTRVSGNNITMVMEKIVVRELVVEHCTWDTETEKINKNFLVELLNVLFLPE